MNSHWYLPPYSFLGFNLRTADEALSSEEGEQLRAGVATVPRGDALQGCLLPELFLLLAVRQHSHPGSGVAVKMQEVHAGLKPSRWGCNLGFSPKYPCLLLNS